MYLPAIAKVAVFSPRAEHKTAFHFEFGPKLATLLYLSARPHRPVHGRSGQDHLVVGHVKGDKEYMLGDTQAIGPMMFICMYIKRERERERDVYIYIYIHIHTHIHIPSFIHSFIHTHADRRRPTVLTGYFRTALGLLLDDLDGSRYEFGSS